MQLPPEHHELLALEVKWLGFLTGFRFGMDFMGGLVAVATINVVFSCLKGVALGCLSWLWGLLLWSF